MTESPAPADSPAVKPALNARNRMDGRALLSLQPAESARLIIYDPQYRGVLDKQQYGNEATGRARNRAALPQMTEAVITEFLQGIEAALSPSAHLLFWLDKYHLMNDAKLWLDRTALQIVDLMIWDKQKFGMGYRTRRQAEYLVIAQKPPIRAKGIWKNRAIPDIWSEPKDRAHAHCKPVKLQATLIDCLTAPEDIVIDPAAGSYSVLEACKIAGRNFLGCDIAGE